LGVESSISTNRVWLIKGKHLTIEEWAEIQKCLEMSMSFKDIARRVGKSPTTISREAKKHLIIKKSMW